MILSLFLKYVVLLLQRIERTTYSMGHSWQIAVSRKSSKQETKNQTNQRLCRSYAHLTSRHLGISTQAFTESDYI